MKETKKFGEMVYASRMLGTFGLERITLMIGQTRLRFEEFELDLGRGALLRDGEEIELRPKSFAVLRLLVENGDRLLSKAEIMDSIWPGVVVTEDSLKQCISEVRNALGDDRHRIIKTVPRRGYRFAAAIARVAPTSDQLQATAPGAIAVHDEERPRPRLPDRPSIAVLPFHNLSREPVQDYLSDGLSEELTTGLSKFKGLFVIARSSAFHYKGQHAETMRVGRELGVRYLLEGSIRREGKRARIATQLLDAADSHHLWADSFDCDVSDVFTVQDEITRKIVVTLVAHIDRAEIDRVLRAPSQRPAAYDHWLRGNAFMREARQSPQIGMLDAARAHYEAAAAIDADFAPAFLGMAETYFSVWWSNRRCTMHDAAQQRDVLDRALALAQKAVELDAGSAEAHAMLGWLLHQQHRRAEGMIEYRCALDLNPNFADGRYGRCLIINGSISEGIEYLQRLIRLDPFHLGFYEAYLGLGYYLGGRLEEALAKFRTAARRMPNMSPPHVGLAATAARLHLHDEAAAAVHAVRRMEPNFSTSEWLSLQNFARAEDAAALAEGLRQAGLPQ